MGRLWVLIGKMASAKGNDWEAREKTGEEGVLRLYEARAEFCEADFWRSRKY